MNIALICQSFLPHVGGIEWKVHHLATEYITRGHTVTVFTMKSEHGRPSGIVHTYELDRCCYNIPGCSRMGIDRWLYYRAIVKKHRHRPFDVLHCHHLGQPTQYGVDVKKSTGVPVVATTCGADVQVLPEIQYGDRLNPRLDRIVKKVIKSVDVVGSISSSVRAELERINTTARIVDIPNGVAWHDFQVGPSTLLRDRLGVDHDSLIILSVGRNHPIKGYESGIRAFARITGRFKKAYYAIVGSGTEKLASLVQQLGLQDQVKLVEQVPMAEIPYMYHSADIFFNPSLMEGFAQVNAQALACALPCVLTDAPGNRDAGDYGGSLIARSGDPESMAQQLSNLLEHQELRKKLGADAHAASRRYAWKRIAEQYLDIFESLITINKH